MDSIERKETKKKTVFTNLFFLLGLIFIVIIGLDLSLRFSKTHIVEQESQSLLGFIEQDPDLLMEYTPKGRRLIPNSHVVIRNHYLSREDIKMDINSLGFRDEEIPEAKGESDIRILVLGDSITWGDYLQKDEVFVERIEGYLNKSIEDKQIQVINAGVGDIGIEEEMNILIERGLSVQPDIVVLGFYLNDSRPPNNFMSELNEWKRLRKYSLLVDTIYRKIKLKQWTDERKERFQWIGLEKGMNWKSNRDDFIHLASLAKHDWGAAWEEDSWEVVESNLDRLKALSLEHDFEVAVIVFPVSFQVYADFIEDSPQRALKEKALERGFKQFDLLPLLRENNKVELFYDYCHPMKKTNDIIGKSVAEFLEKEVLEDRNESGKPN